MKKISVFICVHLWTIFLFVSISAQDFKTVQDGIEYAEMSRGTKEQPIHINLLKLDLTKVKLDVVHAMDSAIGVEKTSSIATRHGAFAAINAGFFRLDTSIFAGDAVGVLQIDDNFMSESYSDRVALTISNGYNKTEVHISRLNISTQIIIGGESYIVTGINRERGENDLIIYTPEFNSTTLTNNKGLEIGVEGNKIKRIFSEQGSTKIIPFSYIISVSGKFQEQISKLASFNTKVTINHKIETLDGNYAIYKSRLQRDIVGGVPQLIKNGKIEITWEQEKAAKAFVENKHPRTAVAKLKDGKFLMITVDGRQPNFSVGMNLQELAEFLLEMGAVDAMNLDGGGSTTMFLDGKIVNKPSDKEGERRVSDAILVTPRRKN